MSQFRAHFASSNAHSLPDVLGCRNPLKIARKDKLQPELIHHVKRHMRRNFYERGFLSHSLLSHLMRTVFTFAITARCGLILLPARWQNRRQIRVASSSDSFCREILLQQCDCGLLKKWQEKWKIHVLLAVIVFVNVAALSLRALSNGLRFCSSP